MYNNVHNMSCVSARDNRTVILDAANLGGMCSVFCGDYYYYYCDYCDYRDYYLIFCVR